MNTQNHQAEGDARPDENKLIAERRSKLDGLRELGQAYPNGYEPLIPDDPDAINRDAGLIELETQEVLLEWGYTYSCTGAGTQADPRLCAVSVTIF